MAGHALAQVILNGGSGLPEDKYVNDFHFETTSDPVGAGNITDIITVLTSFYNDVHTPGTSALATELSTNIVRAGTTIKIYDMNQSPPRVPISVSTFTLTATGGTSPLPNEVSLCNSYRGDSIPGVPLAQTRGRIYLGPLNKDNSASAGGELRPSAAVLNKWQGAAQYLMVNGASVQWSVYSPTYKAAHPTESGLFEITHGFVDNAYDTQRRRGAAATTRQSW